MANAKSETEFKEAAYKFSEIKGYKDAEEKQQHCLELGKEINRQKNYHSAEMLFERAKTIAGFTEAFESAESTVPLNFMLTAVCIVTACKNESYIGILCKYLFNKIMEI